MTELLALCACLLAFAALALAMERHQLTLLAGPLSAGHVQVLRVAGCCWLLAALALLVSRDGWAIALVRYSGHTSLAAGAVYLALIAAERRRARR